MEQPRISRKKVKLPSNSLFSHYDLETDGSVTLYNKPYVGTWKGRVSLTRYCKITYNTKATPIAVPYAAYELALDGKPSFDHFFTVNPSRKLTEEQRKVIVELFNSEPNLSSDPIDPPQELLVFIYLGQEHQTHKRCPDHNTISKVNGVFKWRDE